MHKWFSNVYFAVLENHGWSQVQDCEFVKWFSANGAIFPHWYAAAHPSGPNYRALLSGNTWSLNEFDGVRRENIANHIPSAVVDYAGVAADRHNPVQGHAGKHRGRSGRRRHCLLRYERREQRPQRFAGRR